MSDGTRAADICRRTRAAHACLLGDLDFEGDSGTDVAVAGIGADADAVYAPVFLEAKGRRVALLAALPRHPDPERDPVADGRRGGAGGKTVFEELRTRPNPHDGKGGPCTDLAPAPMGDPRQARFWAVLR